MRAVIRLVLFLVICLCCLFFFADDKIIYLVTGTIAFASYLGTYLGVADFEPLISISAKREYEGDKKSGFPKFRRILEVENIGKSKAFEVVISQKVKDYQNKVLDRDHVGIKSPFILEAKENHRVLLPIDGETINSTFEVVWKNKKGHIFKKEREVNFQ